MIDPGVGSSLAAVLGGSGIGVVWGWCALLLLRRARHHARSLLAITLLGALAGGALRLLSGGWPAVIAFAGAAAAAAWVHAAWLQQIRISSIPKEPR